MDLYTILVLGHILGTTMGLGGAIVAEAQIIQALKDGTVTKDEGAILHANYFLIRVGTALIILSGFGFIWQGGDWVLYDPKLWVKDIMLGVIILNAILLTKRLVPLWLGSALSMASWLGAAILGTMKKVPYSFTTMMIGYIVWIAVVALVLHFIRRRYSSR